MIELMADSPGLKPFGFQFIIVTVFVLEPCLDLHRASHNTLPSGHALAAFAACLFSFPLDDFRIDHFQQSAVVFCNIHHCNPSQNTNLRGSKSDTLSFIHGVCHIIQKRCKPFVKLFLCLAAFPQCVISQSHDFPNSHLFSAFPNMVVLFIIRAFYAWSFSL